MIQIDSNQKSILILVPARKGSKGIPGKNTKLLNGKPLISYTIEQLEGIQTPYPYNIIISTDCEKIQEMKHSIKNIIIHKRRESLATDQSPIFDTIESIVREYKIDKQSTDICILQPTSPLRQRYQIEEALNLYYENDCRPLVSVCSVKHSATPEKVLLLESELIASPYSQYNENIIRRQEIKQHYLMRNGAIYISKLSETNKSSYSKNKLVTYRMDLISSIDIDYPEDWELCERLMKSK